MSAKIHKLYDAPEFTDSELDLIKRNSSIFNDPEQDACPECGRERAVNGGECLLCLEDKLRRGKPVSLSHLPERWPADSAMVMLAKDLISKHHEVAGKAQVAYLMKLKHTEKNGKVVLGTCSKQSSKSKMLHGWDYIIEISWDMWALCDDSQREALLLHEVCHIYKDPENGSPWKLEAHNVEEFIKVIEAYGLWKPDLQAFAEVVKRAEESDPNQRRLFDEDESE